MLNTNYKIKIEGKKRNIYYDNKNKKYYVKINSEKYDVSKLFQKNKKKITGGILTNTILQDECKITNNVVKFLNEYPEINEILYYLKKKDTNFETWDIQEIIVFLNSRNIIFNLNKTDINTDINSEIQLILSFLLIYNSNYSIDLEKKYIEEILVTDEIIKNSEIEYFFKEKLKTFKITNKLTDESTDESTYNISLNNFISNSSIFFKKDKTFTWGSLYDQINNIYTKYPNGYEEFNLYQIYFIMNIKQIKYHLFELFSIDFLFNLSGKTTFYKNIINLLSKPYYKTFNIIPNDKILNNSILTQRHNEFIMLFMITLVKTITNYYDVTNINYPEELEKLKEELKKLKLESNYNQVQVLDIQPIFNELKNLKETSINSNPFMKNDSKSLLHSKIFNNSLDLFLYFLKRFIYNFESEIINHYSNVRVYISINPYSSRDHDKSKKHTWEKDGIYIDNTLNKITYNNIENKTNFKEIFYEKDTKYDLKNELNSKIIKNDKINMEFNNHKYIYCASGYSGSGKTYCLNMLLELLNNGESEIKNTTFEVLELYGELDYTINKLNTELYMWDDKHNCTNLNLDSIPISLNFSNVTQMENYFMELSKKRSINNSKDSYKARIRSTPNNKESSRSHLIINVKNSNENKQIYFKILDMGGTENTKNIKSQYFKAYNNSDIFKQVNNQEIKKVFKPLLKINSNPISFYNNFLNKYKENFNLMKPNNDKFNTADINNFMIYDEQDKYNKIYIYEHLKNHPSNQIISNYKLNINDKIEVDSNFTFLSEGWEKLFENENIINDIEKNHKNSKFLNELKSIIDKGLIKYLINYKTPFMYILYKVLKVIDNNSVFKFNPINKNEWESFNTNDKINAIKIKYMFMVINRLFFETFAYVLPILNLDIGNNDNLIKYNSDNIMGVKESLNKQNENYITYNYKRYRPTVKKNGLKWIFAQNFHENEITYFKLIGSNYKNVFKSFFEKKEKENCGEKLFELFEKIDNYYNTSNDNLNFSYFQDFTKELIKYYITPLELQGNFINESIDIFKNICQRKHLNNPDEVIQYFTKTESDIEKEIKEYFLYVLNFENNDTIKNISDFNTKMVILCCLKFYYLNYVESKKVLNDNQLNELYINPIEKTLEFANSLTAIQDIESSGGKNIKKGGLMNNKFSIFQEKFCYELIIIFYDFISKNGSIDNDKLIDNIKYYHGVFTKKNKLEQKLDDYKIPEQILINCLKIKSLNDKDINTFIIFYYVSAMAIMCISKKYIYNIKNKFKSNPNNDKFEKYFELLSQYNIYIKKEKNGIGNFNTSYNNFKDNINKIKIEINSDLFKDKEKSEKSEKTEEETSLFNLDDFIEPEYIKNRQLTKIKDIENNLEEEKRKRSDHQNMSFKIHDVLYNPTKTNHTKTSVDSLKDDKRKNLGLKLPGTDAIKSLRIKDAIKSLETRFFKKKI